MEDAVDKAVKKAALDIFGPNGYPPHVHSKLCMNIVGDVLLKGEETIMEIKQSMLYSLAPDRIIVTNRRLILSRPSFWGLYTGTNMFSPTELSVIPYHNLVSVIFTSGRVFATIHMRIHGIADTNEALKTEGALDGVTKQDARIFTRFTEDVIESLPFIASQDSSVTTNPNQRKWVPQQHVQAEEQPAELKLINLSKALDILGKRNACFIWLGSGAISEHMAQALKVDRSRIRSIDILSISTLSNEELQRLQYCILVSDDGSIATYVSKALRRDYAINTYVLEGGLQALA